MSTYLTDENFLTDENDSQHSLHSNDFSSPVTRKGLARVIEVLLRPFEGIDIGALPKGGQKLSYLETHACIDRLNEAFTPLGWSWEPGQLHERLTGPKAQTAVYGVLTVHTDFGTIKKGAWGGQDMSTSMADDLKGASSDALKKAATYLGIYNYGYRKDKGPATTDQMNMIDDLKKIYTSLGWNGDQFKEWAGGVLCHTITGVKDISLTQGGVLKNQLEELVKKKK